MDFVGLYSSEFYQRHQDMARQSAKQIVPLILKWVAPTSVVDVGCGSGTWLSVFNNLGIHDYLGVDGPWVKESLLEIPTGHFLSFDLGEPLHIASRFDLVVSLEVAEHLSILEAETFVGSLTRLGPVVLFSAAIPMQGGTHHLNEQWPDYWAQLF